MLTIMYRVVAFGLTSVLILLAAAGIGGASTFGSAAPAAGAAASAIPADGLATAGGAPCDRQTTSGSWQPRPGVTGLAELRWGDGGPPVLVPVGGAR